MENHIFSEIFGESPQAAMKRVRDAENLNQSTAVIDEFLDRTSLASQLRSAPAQTTRRSGVSGAREKFIESVDRFIAKARMFRDEENEG